MQGAKSDIHKSEKAKKMANIHYHFIWKFILSNKIF